MSVVKNFFSEFSKDYFNERKKENILIVVGLVVLNIVCIFAIPGFLKIMTRWFVWIPSVIVGAMGFFYDTGNRPLQLAMKILALPAILIIIVVGLAILVILGAGSNSSKSSYSKRQQSSKEYSDQLKMDSANMKLKHAEQEKRTAESLLANSTDKHVRAEAEHRLARANKDITVAKADMMEVKTGDSFNASLIRSAASNKAVADVGKMSSDKNFRNDAYLRSEHYGEEIEKRFSDMEK